MVLASAPAEQPRTFEELVRSDVRFEGKRMIPLPAKLPRRALRFETAPANKGPLLKLPWVGVPGRTDAGQRTPWAVLLGEMLFHSPRMIGALNVRMGVSCNHCHPNGSTNPYVFTEHSYMVPGRIDLSTGYFSQTGDNGILDAHVVPTLRGIRFTAPYQLDGKVAGLREQIRHVIVGEFGTPEPPPYMLDALLMFLEQLDPLPNPKIDQNGALTDKASAVAKRGEAAFHKARAELGGQSCASCHIPELGFTDGKVHPLGYQRERYDTPTLLGLVNTPPYLHDARAKTIAEAVSEVETLLGTKLQANEKAELVEYLQAIGDEQDAYEPPSRARRAAQSLAFLELLIEGPYANDPLVWRMTLETITLDLDEQRPQTLKSPALTEAWSGWQTLANAAAARAPGDDDRKALAAAREKLQAAFDSLEKPKLSKEVP